MRADDSQDWAGSDERPALLRPGALRWGAQWRPWLWRVPSPRRFAVFGFGRFQISANEPLSSSSIRLAKIGCPMARNINDVFYDVGLA
jgi:hypothetical protein